MSDYRARFQSPRSGYESSYATISSSRAFVPTDVAGLVLWLNADTLSGNNGDAIGTWANQAPATGSASDAAQGTGANKPTLLVAANGINGHQAVRFDGTNGFMTGSIAIPGGATTMGIIWTARTGAALASYSTVFSSNGVSTSRTTGIRWRTGVGNDATQGAGWAGPDSTINLGAVTGVAINTVYFGSFYTNSVAWKIDGVNNTTPADTSFATGGVFNYCIGREGQTVNSYSLNGDIAEILVYMS